MLHSTWWSFAAIWSCHQTKSYSFSNVKQLSYISFKIEIHWRNKHSQTLSVIIVKRELTTWAYYVVTFAYRIMETGLAHQPRLHWWEINTRCLIGSDVHLLVICSHYASAFECFTLHWNVSELWDLILRLGLSTCFLLFLCQHSCSFHAVFRSGML